MCCGRRRPHQPLLITLGAAAYTAYQDRQAKRDAEQKAIASPSVAQRHAEPTLDNAMRSLNLEKQGADVPPPDYEDVIVHRTMVDSSGRDIIADDRNFAREKEAYLSDPDSSIRESEGRARVLQPDTLPSWALGTGTWKERRAVWKAEKKARKAEWKAARSMVKEQWKADREARRAARRSCC